MNGQYIHENMLNIFSLQVNKLKLQWNMDMYFIG